MLKKTIVRNDCGTPFHARTSALNSTTWWYGWTDYVIPDVFSNIDDEVAAIRNSVAVIDMSPLPKVEFSGPDAARYIDYLSVRSAANNEVGHVLYTAWCTHEGKLITDGLAFRLEEDRFLVSSDSSFQWFLENRDGFQFCRIRSATIGGVEVFVARQGFTGELGYEIWVKREDGLELWDAIFAAGAAYDIQPAGEYALDVARMEAGLTLASADYTNPGPDGRSAHVVVNPNEVSTPYEVGLGYLVHLDKGDFIGREALLVEMEQGGATRSLVGLEICWQDILEHYAANGKPPEVAPRVRWDAMPITVAGKLVGRASSVTWSPTLQKLVAFACLDKSLTELGTKISIDWSDQWFRPVGRVGAEVIGLPFIDMKRAEN